MNFAYSYLYLPYFSHKSGEVGIRIDRDRDNLVQKKPALADSFLNLQSCSYCLILSETK